MPGRAFPQARSVAAAESGTGRLLGAAIDKPGEPSVTRRIQFHLLHRWQITQTRAIGSHALAGSLQPAISVYSRATWSYGRLVVAWNVASIGETVTTCPGSSRPPLQYDSPAAPPPTDSCPENAEP